MPEMATFILLLMCSIINIVYWAVVIVRAKAITAKDALLFFITVFIPGVNGIWVLWVGIDLIITITDPGRPKIVLLSWKDDE